MIVNFFQEHKPYYKSIEIEFKSKREDFNLKAVFQLDTLQCPVCVKQMEEDLKYENGVLSVKVFPQLGKIRAEFNEKLIPIERIEEIIDIMGYLVRPKGSHRKRGVTNNDKNTTI